MHVTKRSTDFIGHVIKDDLIMTHEFLDVDVSKLGTHFQPVSSVCKQYWTVSLQNLDCHCGPMIQ